MPTKNMKLVELVEDFGIYPRSSVSSTNVSRLRRSVRLGEDVGPIVADEKTLAIIDGFHRRRAILAEKGDKAVWPVELRTYKSRKYMFMDSVLLNTGHGLALNQYERTKCQIRGEELGLTKKEMASMLRVEMVDLERIEMTRMSRIVPSDGPPRRHALKRPMYHLAGRRITQKQAAITPVLGGRSAGQLAKELRILLQTNSVNLDNDDTAILMADLFIVLERVVKDNRLLQLAK